MVGLIWYGSRQIVVEKALTEGTSRPSWRQRS
jgi:hypothetical protein